jgi:hypothetical protein
VLQTQNEVPLFLDEGFKRELALALDQPEDDTILELRSQKPRIMSSRVVNSLPEQTRAGLNTAKQYILRKVRDLEDLQNIRDANALRVEITKFSQNLERFITRL